MTSKSNSIAGPEAGGVEWRKIRARRTGETVTLDAADIRHEFEDEARNEREVYSSVVPQGSDN